MAAAQVAAMSPQAKLEEAMRRALPRLPAEARAAVESMLTPESMAIITGTLVVWAGSHFFGVGEIVDVVLVGIGAITLGFAVFEGSSELYSFVTGAIDATTDAGLDKAAAHFAQAVTLLGISTIQALLLKGQARSVIARGRPQIHSRPNVGPPPPAGNEFRIFRPAQLPGGTLGETTAYGTISVARNQPLSEQRLTLLHELVHRYFSPRTGPLRQLRAELSMSAYSRSVLIRYLEEALAEGYAQLRMQGLSQAIAALRFPLQNGYLTASELVTEGMAIGTIVVGGALVKVSVSHGPMPR